MRRQADWPRSARQAVELIEANEVGLLERATRHAKAPERTIDPLQGDPFPQQQNRLLQCGLARYA